MIHALTYEAHLRKLGDELDVVQIVLDPVGDWHGSCSWFPTKEYPSVWSLGREWEVSFVQVNGWKPDSTVSYYVGLHELGHHAHRHSATEDNYRRRVVEAEAEAWAWALDTAQTPLTAEVAQLIRDEWLGWYVRNNPAPAFADTTNEVLNIAEQVAATS